MVTHEQIVIEFVLKGVDNIKGGMKQVQDSVGKVNKTIFDAKTMISLNQEEFRRLNKMGPQLMTWGGRLVNTFRRITHGLRGFRMEMLGVMFFGMGMQRMFMGLLQPAMQLAGIFDIWSVILQVLFLPVTLLMLPTMLGILDAIMKMDEPTQVMIGAFVLFGAAVGTALFLVGTLALGLGSITLAFGGLVGKITGARTGLEGLPVLIEKPATAGFSLKGALIGVGKALLSVTGLIAVGIGLFEGLKFAAHAVGSALNDVGIDVGFIGDNFGSLEKFIQKVGFAFYAVSRIMGVLVVGSITTLGVKVWQLMDLFSKVTGFLVDPFKPGALAGVGVAAKRLFRLDEFEELGLAITTAKDDYWHSIRALEANTAAVKQQEKEIEDTIDVTEDMNVAMARTGEFTYDLGAAQAMVTEMMEDMTVPLAETTLQTKYLANSAFDAGDELTLFTDGLIANRNKFLQAIGAPAAAVSRGGRGGGIMMTATGKPVAVNVPLEKEITIGDFTYPINQETGGLITAQKYRKLQFGGIVAKPTVALLGERGPEMVTPLGEGGAAMTISPTYNITASISNDMDIRRLAERLNDLLTSDYRRLTYR